MRGARMSINSSLGPNPSLNSLKNEDSGIYSNFELTYVLSRHVIGNIGEVTTTENDRVFGVIQAISPSGDMGLGYPYKACAGKNGHISGAAHIVPLSNWKIIKIPNVKITDCLLEEIKVESDVNRESDSSAPVEEKELVPFFESSDTPKDCFLDEGEFTVEEMFKTNKELFSVSTTYDPDLPEYKTPVDKNAPNYHETEARCAQIAREIEASDFYTENLDDICEDEGISLDKGRGSSRMPTVPKLAIRDPHTNRNLNSDISHVTKHVAQLSVLSSECAPGIPPSNLNSHPSNGQASGIPAVNDTPTEIKLEPGVAVALPPVCNIATLPSTESNDSVSSVKPAATTEIKVKKSTLDPNAPLFQPLSMQPPSSSTSAQVTLHNLAFTHVIHPSSNPNSSIHAALPSLTAFVAAPQPQLYAPSSMSYGSQAVTLPHVMSAAFAASAASNAVQHMRGGSVPPSFHQPFPMGVNTNPGVLLQSNQQNVSLAQMLPSVGNTNRFSNPLPRQCSNELATTNSQNSYGQLPNMTVSAMQPPFYQIPQTGAGIPLWVTGAPQMGFNFVPGAGNSSALMVSNLQLPQAGGQQIYPAHAMVHIQPQLGIPTMSLESGPATVNQSQHHPIFQAQPGQFSEHPLQIPQYAQGMMFAQQTGGFYPTAPLLAGPGVLNHAVRAGLVPVMNQPTAQHPGVTHQPATLDSLSVNQSLPASSFPPSNCQPHLPNYNAPHPLLQAAPVNPQNIQPDYQNIFALFARNFSQGH